MAERVTSVVADDRTMERLVRIGTGTGAGGSDARHAPAATASEAEEGPESRSRLRRSLRRLVQAHAASNVTDPERECLAGAVYFEAQGEPIEGQLAVAEVVLNRAASGEYPSSICEVVTAAGAILFRPRRPLPADRQRQRRLAQGGCRCAHRGREPGEQAFLRRALVPRRLRGAGLGAPPRSRDADRRPYLLPSRLGPQQRDSAGSGRQGRVPMPHQPKPLKHNSTVWSIFLLTRLS